MIYDPITWFLLILLIVLLLMLLFWLSRKKPVEPWVLYDSISVPDRTTQDVCGDQGTLVSINSVRNLNVHVELENRGDCKVTLSIGRNAFIEAKAPIAPLGRPVTYVAAYVPLPAGLGITYKCSTDASGKSECIFRARITVR